MTSHVRKLRENVIMEYVELSQFVSVGNGVICGVRQIKYVQVIFQVPTSSHSSSLRLFNIEETQNIFKKALPNTLYCGCIFIGWNDENSTVN